MEWIKIILSAGGLLWTIFGFNSEADEARRRADIWFNWFCIAVIVIAVLAFIIWKQHRIIVRKTAKEPEELQSAIISCENPEKEQKLFSRNGIRESHQ